MGRRAYVSAAVGTEEQSTTPQRLLESPPETGTKPSLCLISHTCDDSERCVSHFWM